MKRVFIGIKISSELQDEALKWKRDHQDLPVRWIARSNLHITLLPPWDVAENEIEKIKNDLDGIKDEVKHFSLQFLKISYGLDPKNPRLIWAEGEAPKAIVELKQRIETTLGLKCEKRNFKLHLTLARFRTETFSSFSVKTLDDNILWNEKVDKFELIESILMPTGADYTTLHKFNFNNAASV